MNYYQFAHGTLAMYNRHGCRCDECKAIKKVFNAKRYPQARVAQLGERGVANAEVAGS